MDASDIKKMKDLEDENRRLKQMFADLSLEALTDVIEKTLKPAIKRELVNYLTAQFAMNVRPAYGTFSLTMTVYFYRPDFRREERMIQSLAGFAEC